jgi:hypothetical protein
MTAIATNNPGVTCTITMIVTQGRQVTPRQAVTVFKERLTTEGERLSILRQLIERSQEYAAQVADFVIKNQAQFIQKTVRLANEFAKNCPIGPKAITSPAQVFEILLDGGEGGEFRITFAEEHADKVTLVTDLTNHIICFENLDNAMFLADCVKSAGSFGTFSRIYSILLVSLTRHEMELAAQAIAATCESIELLEVNIKHLSVLQKSILHDMLTEHPELIYSEPVFRMACATMDRLSEAHIWLRGITDPNAGMQQVLDVVPQAVRILFLEQYIKAFGKILVV